MRIVPTGICTLAFVMTAPALAQQLPLSPERDAHANASVLAKLHAHDQLTIAASKLALERAGSSDVKRFARQLVLAKRRCDRELVELARKKNLSIGDAQGDAQTSTDDDALHKLEKLEAEEFDHAFLQLDIESDGAVIELIRDTKDDAQDIELRRFLGALLPELEAQRDRALTLSHDR